MKLIIFFFITGAAIWAFKTFVNLRRQQKRQAIVSASFPQEWSVILHDNLPPFQNLSQRLQQQLQNSIRIFISEKSFEGCGGLVLTDEIKVTIAAQVCMLLLNRRCDCYPKRYSRAGVSLHLCCRQQKLLNMNCSSTEQEKERKA